MIFEPLTLIIGFLACWLIGTVIYLFVSIVRPALIHARKRLYQIGKVIYQAAVAFRDSDATPEVFDRLIDAALIKWGALSNDVWRLTDKAITELEDLAEDLVDAINRWRKEKAARKEIEHDL